MSMYSTIRMSIRPGFRKAHEYGISTIDKYGHERNVEDVAGELWNKRKEKPAASGELGEGSLAGADIDYDD